MVENIPSQIYTSKIKSVVLFQETYVAQTTGISIYLVKISIASSLCTKIKMNSYLIRILPVLLYKSRFSFIYLLSHSILAADIVISSLSLPELKNRSSDHLTIILQHTFFMLFFALALQHLNVLTKKLKISLLNSFTITKYQIF